MKVYKFGGASVNSSEGVERLTNIVSKETDKLIIVISAMGKTTNMLEEVLDCYYNAKPNLGVALDRVKRFHLDIISELFASDSSIYSEVEGIFSLLQQILSKQPSLSYDFEYDRIVSFGEILSTTIVSQYINQQGVNNSFVDIREVLKTDDNYREGIVDYNLSKQLVGDTMNFEGTNIYVTQGFIAGTITNQTITLGREGSDYSAALLASMLNAESVTIWKDVPGVMNADPKLYDKVDIIRRLSYKEAIELSYCGATIIHPKTIKPLKAKKIPLLVKSFLNPEAEGSVINDFYEKISMPPIYIHKKNQVLLTLTPRDFSFVAEEKLSSIFLILASYKVKASLMQTSAISFSFCIDYNTVNFDDMVKELQDNYEVLYNTDVELLTIRHYTKEILDDIFDQRVVFVEQRSRLTVRLVLPISD